jgi:hypothetical protein
MKGGRSDLGWLTADAAEEAGPTTPSGSDMVKKGDLPSTGASSPVQLIGLSSS